MSKIKAEQIIDGSMDEPISEVYSVIDTDLARDNLENDMTVADLQDLKFIKKNEHRYS